MSCAVLSCAVCCSVLCRSVWSFCLPTAWLSYLYQGTRTSYNYMFISIYHYIHITILHSSRQMVTNPGPWAWLLGEPYISLDDYRKLNSKHRESRDRFWTDDVCTEDLYFLVLRRSQCLFPSAMRQWRIYIYIYNYIEEVISACSVYVTVVLIAAAPDSSILVSTISTWYTCHKDTAINNWVICSASTCESWQNPPISTFRYKTWLLIVPL